MGFGAGQLCTLGRSTVAGVSECDRATERSDHEPTVAQISYTLDGWPGPDLKLLVTTTFHPSVGGEEPAQWWKQQSTLPLGVLCWHTSCDPVDPDRSCGSLGGRRCRRGCAQRRDAESLEASRTRGTETPLARPPHVIWITNQPPYQRVRRQSSLSVRRGCGAGPWNCATSTISDSGGSVMFSRPGSSVVVPSTSEGVSRP
jgi:hypothetical protein